MTLYTGNFTIQVITWVTFFKVLNYNYTITTCDIEHEHGVLHVFPVPPGSPVIFPNLSQNMHVGGLAMLSSP